MTKQFLEKLVLTVDYACEELDPERPVTDRLYETLNERLGLVVENEICTPVNELLRQVWMHSEDPNIPKYEGEFRRTLVRSMSEQLLQATLLAWVMAGRLMTEVPVKMEATLRKRFSDQVATEYFRWRI